MPTDLLKHDLSGALPDRRPHINDTDRDAAIAYLTGLQVILQQLDEEGRGRDGGDDLLERLRALPDGVSESAPLRYQTADGQGWAYVARNVQDLIKSLRSA